MQQTATDSSQILQVGFGFWASKVLLTAVELDVFTALGERPQTGQELGQRLGLHPRGTQDFFDALVALGFLERDGNGPQARFRNTANTAAHLDRNQAGAVHGRDERTVQAKLRDLRGAVRFFDVPDDVHAFGLLMSLNMLIEFGDAFDFTGADYRAWCREAGFRRFDVIPLDGPCSAAVAYK